MEKEPASPSQDQVSETLQQPKSGNNKLFVVVAASILLTATVVGFAVYFWQKTVNEETISTLEQKVSSLEKQISEERPMVEEDTGQASPTLTQTPTDQMIIYKDPNSRYTFRYPSSWKVIDKVPEKFRAATSYVESGDLEEWLGGKMMAETCRGPILQNTSDTNQLIVFEIVDARGDGGFCWSLGYFMDDDKWKVSERYAYPVGSNNLHEPEWKGDYFKMEKAKESSAFIAFVSLVNYETFQLKGEDVLQSIISSFQFTE